MVVTAQPVARLAGRHRDRPVVTAVTRVLAPGIDRRDAADRKPRYGPRTAISAPPEPDGPKYAARRAAIALALVGQNPAKSKRHRPGERAGPHDTAGARAGRSTYINCP